MTALQSDCFVVYVRDEDPSGDGDMVERELVRCPSQEEAKWICHKYAEPTRQFVIRYLGPAGGGD